MPAQEIPSRLEMVAPRLTEIIQRLEFVQRTTGSYFFIPAEFSALDLRALDRAERLLRGDRVMVSWSGATIRLEVDRPEVIPAIGSINAFLFAEPDDVIIAGHSIRLGQTMRHLLSARVADWRPEGGDHRGQLILAPAENRDAEMWLPGKANESYVPIPGVSSSFLGLVDEFMDENAEVLRRLAQ